LLQENNQAIDKEEGWELVEVELFKWHCLI
jgi:hypothetical protein